MIRGEVCFVPYAYLRGIDWENAAASVTFSLDKRLLLAAAPNTVPGVTGELVWVRLEGHAASGTLLVCPVLIVHTAPASCPVDCVKLVPHLPAHDPLLHHIALVLQASTAAEGIAGKLYAEVLINALAAHLLRRYAACEPLGQEVIGGLAPYKLRRTTAYIQTHLEHALPLAALAAEAQTSAAHFARLFKQATGQTPHRFVISCRIDRAKQLLTETTLSLSEVGLQVGCTDQSYFTALFRKQVGVTPKAYRGATTKA